jgi:metallo-beta-lactamase family protein
MFKPATPDQLLKWIEKACIQKKGKLIMPAFSVGRTQEILYALNQLELERRLPAIEYFVDSPLSVKQRRSLKITHMILIKSFKRCWNLMTTLFYSGE